MRTFAPAARDGSALNWLVVNPAGKLLAILDSESEAYFFSRNRGHAQGAVSLRAPCDYAAAPDLREAAQRLLSDWSDGRNLTEAAQLLARAVEHSEVKP